MKINRRTISEDFASAYFYDLNEIDEKDILAFTEASQKEKTHSKIYMQARYQDLQTQMLYTV